MANWRRYGAAHVGSFAWASLPAASSCSGCTARVTNVGAAPGELFISDGTNWCPAGPVVLNDSAAASSVTGTTDKTTLATVTLPANLLAGARSIDISTLWSFSSNGNAKNPEVAFGGTAYHATTGASIASQRTNVVVHRIGAASQIGFILTSTTGTGTSASANVTSSIDETAAIDITFAATLAVGGDTATLRARRVVLMP